MKWPSVPVSEIAKQVRGVSYDKSQVSNNPSQGLIPILRAGNIQDGSLLLSQDLVFVPESCVSSQQLLRPGDIVVAASSGSLDVVGKAAQIQKQWQGSFGAFCKVVRPASDRIDPRYLHHFFQSSGYRRKVSSLAAGANINNLKNEHIDDLEISLPPMEEQRRIAAILDKADSIHRLAIDREGIWPKLTRALFYEMFGGVNSNPYGFRLATLGELLSSSEVFIDGDWVESKDQDPSGDVRLIQLADVGDGFYIDKSSRFLTYETSARLRCTYLKPGDILVARMPDPLCRACIFPGDERAAVTVVDVCIIRVDHSSVDPAWLTWMINSTEFRVNALRAASGTTRSRVSRGNLSKLPVLMPPLETQRHFAQILSKSLSLFGRQNDSCSQISGSHVKSLISSLSAEVFGGKY